MPLSFTCPLCGKQTMVAKQYAGQTGPCAECGGLVTVPGDSQLAAVASSSGGSGAGSVLAVVVVLLLTGVLLCGGLGYFVLKPALDRAQAAAQQAALRTESSNKLRNLGIALHNYHDAYHAFPPAVVTAADGTPLYSGRVLLLPFLGRDDLYRHFDKTKSWDDPANQAVAKAIALEFIDPAYAGPNAAGSNYVFVTGPNTIFDGSQSTNMASVTDGTSNTLMMIETSAGATHWAKPEDWDSTGGQLPPGNHNGVVLVLFADGSVRAVLPQGVGGILNRLTIRNDGQVVPGF